ncbi:MAG TPA: hypothetical protein VFX59_22545 [Polyangiales bacterium]|nr:hypothetical protein [Polyangiales bacterium]
MREVMMSGVAESMIRRRCRASFDAFLCKPFSLDERVRTVGGPARRAANKRNKRAS